MIRSAMVIASVSTASQTKWSRWAVQYFKFSPWRQKILDIKCSLRLLETKFTRRITRDQVVTKVLKSSFKSWIFTRIECEVIYCNFKWLQFYLTNFSAIPISSSLSASSMKAQGTLPIYVYLIPHVHCKSCAAHISFFHVHVARAISTQSFYN